MSMNTPRNTTNTNARDVVYISQNQHIFHYHVSVNSLIASYLRSWLLFWHSQRK